MRQVEVVDAGGVVRGGDGRRVDRELEVARQVGIEERYRADDLVDPLGRGAGDIAHDRGLGEALDAVDVEPGVTAEIIGEVGPADAIADAAVSHGRAGVGCDGSQIARRGGGMPPTRSSSSNWMTGASWASAARASGSSSAGRVGGRRALAVVRGRVGAATAGGKGQDGCGGHDCTDRGEGGSAHGRSNSGSCLASTGAEPSRSPLNSCGLKTLSRAASVREGLRRERATIGHGRSLGRLMP